jgi:16S rRNA (adenine1518-N6/adenine1519-N6)-dimethyltransferase
MVRPKKSLGQHFLKDQNIAKKIASCIDEYQNPILEIGPGTGVMTKFLTEKHIDFYAIEVDDESVEYLLQNSIISSDKLIQGDFLEFDLKSKFNGHFAIVGNFPYNISSQIFFKVLENRAAVDEVVCMIQKEVAERISTTPGSKTYGILSVLLQAYYDIKYLFTVNENVFVPPPKVKSAVIKLTRNTNQKLDCDEALFFRVVKMAFNQRRKTLRNSLRSLYSTEILSNEIFNKRPEQLGVKEFVYLTKMV